ncbi:hypothetical protein Btru_068693 [Bulinus truncatus]|nr:hypothetical protein Btru_068693 [Bulinus truncatus]
MQLFLKKVNWLVSFGVVLWEMVTLAAQPYQGLSNEEVVRFVSDGCIMDMPENCPEDMAYLMRCCWEKKPNRRPTFKAVIRFLLPKLKPSFEKVSYYYSSGNTHDGSGDGILELFEGSDDASSNNSLSCEGAAAPRQSSLTRSSAGGNSHFKGSDIVFQYSDDIVPQNYIHNDDEEDSFNSEYGDDIDDSSLPFMPDSYVSTIGTRQPIQLSHQAIENDTSLHNSGLIELKPLINKDKSLGTSSPRLFTVQQSTSPRLVTVQQSSDYLGHQPPTLKTEMEPLHGNHSLPQNNPPYQSTADPLRSASPSTGASSQQLTRHHTPGALAPRPNLRLPTLNQTAVAALYNVSLLNSGDKDKNSDLSRNSQFCSSDQSFSQTAAPLSTVDLVHIENGLGASTATSPSLPDQHYSSSIPGAIASNSSDGSKESTKSSESYSLRNGLTNGHIYLPSDRHRTAHC